MLKSVYQANEKKFEKVTKKNSSAYKICPIIFHPRWIMKNNDLFLKCIIKLSKKNYQILKNTIYFKIKLTVYFLLLKFV